MFKLQKVLRTDPNIELTVQLRNGDALVTRTRANLVSGFLDNPTATHLLFIDADIGFEPDQVLRLLSCGGDVVAGVYPIKRIDWQRVRRAVETRTLNIRSAALNYVLEFEDPDRTVPAEAFARARHAGAGFLMIRRHAIEKMCQHYNEFQFRREHSIDDSFAESRYRFALFECMIDAETGTYLSGDFSFRKRWTDVGGQMWIDLQSRLNIVGPSTFYSDVATQFLESRQAGDGPSLPSE